MTVEADIFTALKRLVADRVYRNLAPQPITALPCIVFQQVGGVPVNFIESAVASKKNARFQVRCWAQDYDAAAVLSRQVEDALKAYAPLQTTTLTAAVSEPEPDNQLFGTRQDFSFWF